MFKIESYITPIIINYIDKYVKDFRPQNAQVSLWGGEVSFQNLDIRLDVLQQELHLPLNIVSGHIHELTIRVPWTKIASEPIQINVNTIEFVVKLKSDTSDKKEKETENIQQAQIVQEPPGYMASLINKIANNISIKLNNIIFKYIEDDIVLSMNIQMLSIDSADDDWNPAFIDVNSTKVALKKVININDLTICLDKRNAQGKIDVCQEPILYRCSLQARMIRKYNLSTAHLASITRIDIFTDNIDFKISVQQFPMLIRLYLLIQMLREIHANLYINRNRRYRSEIAGGGSTTIDNYVDGSYTTWIWNMLPEIFPQSIEDEHTDTHGHIYHNGFYAKTVNIILKSQEIVSSTIIQTNTTYKYHPFLKISMSGVSFDAISVGRKWYNLKGGVSYIGIFPMGSCTCGKKHNLPTIFLAGKKMKGDNGNFLNDSLKDPTCYENNNQNRIYDSDFQTHMQLYTEEELLKQNPAFAIDIVSYRQVLDDIKSYGSQSISSRDGDTTTEEYFVRAIFGKFNLKIDTSLLHLWQTLTDHYNQYTYTAPYLPVKSPDIWSQLTPASTEDYESLLDCIPLRKYNLYLKSSMIELYHLNPEHLQTIDSNEFHQFPYFMILLKEAEINMISPLYPDKLVHTTCQLPDPSEKLKQNCYTKTKALIGGLSVQVIFNKNRFNALSIETIILDYGALIKPEFWKLTQMQTYTFKLVISEGTTTFNKPQLMLLQQMIDSFMVSDNASPRKNIKNLQLIEVNDRNLPIIDICLKQLHSSAITIENIIGVKMSLASICGLIYELNDDDSPKLKTIFLSNEKFDSELLNCSVQYPLEVKDMKYPPILSFTFGKAILNFDNLIQQFLNYNILFETHSDNMHSTDDKAQKRVRKSSKISKHFLRTESVHSNSVTTLSIVNNAQKTKERDKPHLFKWYDIIKRLIVYIDFKSFTIVCPDKSISSLQSTDASLSEILSSSKDVQMTIFRLPSVEIQTSKFKNIQNIVRTRFPILLTDTWSTSVSGFPWNIELNAFNCSNLLNSNETIFLPSVNTKLTLDLTSKVKETELNSDDVSFVIHLDTTPISLKLYTSQVKQIYESVALLSACFIKPNKKQSAHLLDTSATIYDTQITDFICETTNSEKSSEDILSEMEKSHSKVNCLIQWTITKITIALFCTKEINEIEVALELEDIITSVDKQSTYTKVKTKFGSLNGIRRKKNLETNAIDLLTIIGKSETIIDESQDTFFEMVSTTAIAKNVHSRWGTTTKKALGFRDGTETITEIQTTLQSIDIKVELDVITVILAMNSEIKKGKLIVPNEVEANVMANVLSVKDLPLIFFDCKGIQMWIPNSNDLNSDTSDVLIVKINAITITPSVENPIQRKPVREDIYIKAAQLRMINTPGALIEDRQYELLFKNISLVTGNWNEILNFSNPSNNENPAFDWNNQTQKPSLNVNTLLNGFVMSVIFAPAIIFQNIIVCGQALELNCVNDFSVNVTLNDINLLNNLYQKFTTLLSAQDQPDLLEEENVSNKNYLRTIRKGTSQILNNAFDQFDNQFSDSGFKSNLNPEKPKLAETTAVLKTEIPYSFSFVGGLFAIQMFRYSNDDVEKRDPLLSVRFKQPNLYFVQDQNECIQQISLYNLSVQLHDRGIFEKSGNVFGDNIFDTYRGELDETGISPTLFELKKTINLISGERKVQCAMRRPIQLRFTPKSVEKLLHFQDTIEKLLYREQVKCHRPRSIVRYNKIKEIKKLIGDMNCIEFSMVKFTVNFMTSTNCLLSLCFFKFDSKINLQEHPQQLILNANINSFVLNTESSMILHPMSVNFDCTLTQEKWNRRLLITSNIASNVIDLQISPNDIQTFAKIQVEFLACINRHSKAVAQTTRFTEHAAENENQLKFIDASDLIRCDLPKVTSSSTNAAEEYFQDDLRLGTFEYITAGVDSSLPLPYQIYLSTNANEMQICWRYPHPRTINFIQIYPIPGESSANIQCRLEYFQESHNTFFPFVLFEIGNKKTYEVDLPKRKLAAASVWRIVLMDPFASLRDTEFEDNTIEDILNPKTIIGCIRIDSLFNVQNIPIIQTNVKVNRISLSILNNVLVMKHQVPDILQQYSLKVEEHIKNTQEFCTINLADINANINLYADMELKIYNEFGFSVEIFDSSYLTMIPFIDKVLIKCYIVNNAGNHPNLCCVTADTLNIRYGPTVGSAIATAEQIWQNILKDVESKNRLPIMTRYAICNSTSVSLKFGQDLTDEQIWLQVNECFYYAFRSEKCPQRLKFSVKMDDSVVEVTESFVVNDAENGVHYSPVIDGKYLLITSQKISTTQRKITIKGQIELLNMTKESFQVQYKNKNVKFDTDQVLVKNQCVILLAAGSIGSVFESFDDSSDASIRLQIANVDGNGWSGEIPLGKATVQTPWLVKIPSKTAQKFITYCVRIHTEYSNILTPPNRKPKRILIVLWPLFSARSLLPIHLTATDTEFNKNYVLLGEGSCKDLQVAGTFDTEHEFLFDFGVQKQHNWKTILTYKNIDKKAFFAIPERYKCIDDILVELEKPGESKWPCSKDEEWLINRQITNQIWSTPHYKFSASRELSCSMRLEVLPWALIINNLGCEIKLINSTDKNSCLIQPNHIAIPMAIANAFTIKLRIHDEWFESCTINLYENRSSARSQAFINLPENGTIITEILNNEQLTKFCVKSEIENSIRIISISPVYIICNYSEYKLKFGAFCVQRNEKFRFNSIANAIESKLSFNEIPNNIKDEIDSYKGCACLTFHDLSQKSNKSNKQNDCNFFITVGIEKIGTSLPLLLNKSIIRTAFGIQGDQENISLAVTITDHKEQHFITVYEDRHPFIQIDNQTNIDIYVAEADFADFSKSLKPKRSIHDENFQWLCKVFADSCLSYTPPSINERFPEKQNSNIHLIFGCANNLLPDSAVQWSIPIETNKSDDKYLAIPLYGDIKMTSSKANKTIQILLQHIDFKKEFNVKVVHTKLSAPIDVRSEENVPLLKEAQLAEQSDRTLSRLRVVKPVKKSTLHSMNADVYIKEINFILYDEDKNNLHKKNDIVSLFLDNLFVCYTEEKRALEVGFSNIQIDNRLYSSGKYDFPVIFCGQNTNRIPTTNHSNVDGNSNDTSSNNLNSSNFCDTIPIEDNSIMPTPFSLHLLKPLIFKNQLAYIKITMEASEFSAKEVFCNVKPLRIYIEDKFITALLDFAIANLPSNIIYTSNSNTVEKRITCDAGEILIPKIITEQILSFLSEPLRLEHICIRPLSALLSVHTCMRMYIALDHSPLHFAQFESRNIYTTTMRLGYNIGMHYVSDAIFGAGWVVGSLEILGSPSGLARSVSTGLWDFVSMPVQGLMRGPWGVLLGITYGSASLIKNITAGTVNSVTKLAASVARNLDRLTLDDEHLERTEALRRTRPLGITHGITQGLTGFGMNLLGAVGGIARHALEAKSSVEVFTGLGKGLIGIVTKPISGAAELLALTGQGVLQSVGFNTMPISRGEICSNDTMPTMMSITKVTWKILSKINYADRVLIVLNGLLVDNTESSQEIAVAVTSELIILIALQSSELIKVLTIATTRATTDDKKKPNVLLLTVKSDEEIQQYHHKRILQYLSKAYDQSTDVRPNVEEDIANNITPNETNKSTIIFEDANHALYLSKYLQFLYFCLNSSK